MFDNAGFGLICLLLGFLLPLGMGFVIVSVFDARRPKITSVENYPENPMLCLNCGRIVECDAKFCKYCGKEI